jgi:hypothetical protein
MKNERKTAAKSTTYHRHIAFNVPRNPLFPRQLFVLTPPVKNYKVTRNFLTVFHSQC